MPLLSPLLQMAPSQSAMARPLRIHADVLAAAAQLRYSSSAWGGAIHAALARYFDSNVACVFAAGEPHLEARRLRLYLSHGIAAGLVDEAHLSLGDPRVLAAILAVTGGRAEATRLWNSLGGAEVAAAAYEAATSRPDAFTGSGLAEARVAIGWEALVNGSATRTCECPPGCRPSAPAKRGGAGPGEAVRESSSG